MAVRDALMTDPPEPSLADLDIAEALVPTAGLYLPVEASELPDDAQVLAREYMVTSDPVERSSRSRSAPGSSARAAVGLLMTQTNELGEPPRGPRDPARSAGRIRPASGGPVARVGLGA